MNDDTWRGYRIASVYLVEPKRLTRECSVFERLHNTGVQLVHETNCWTGEWYWYVSTECEDRHLVVDGDTVSFDACGDYTPFATADEALAAWAKYEEAGDG